MEEHSKIRYQCLLCLKSYVNDDSALRHLRESHFGRVHQCHLCESKFTRRTNLAAHIRNVHPGETMRESSVTVSYQNIPQIVDRAPCNL